MQKLTVTLPLIALAICSILYLPGCGTTYRDMGEVAATQTAPPNYWCTWYWQNYLIRKGEEVTDPDATAIFSNEAARESMNEANIFGAEGMAVVMLPRTRKDFYFVIDHGWQDKSIDHNTFFTLIMDTLDFPRYAHLPPRDRLKQMNEDIKALGWRGLGLWVRGNPTESEMKTCVEWSRYAGIEYWKIDGGDTDHFYATKWKKSIYPDLTLEHITGAGPINPKWDIPGLTLYPSVYNGEVLVSQELDASLEKLTKKVEESLETIKNTDVFRTYDAAPLLVTTTTLQRVHDILVQTAGKPEYRAYLNVQDDSNVAAALGLLIAAKRHPMHTPRLYKGKDFHLQIAGDRQVDKRLNELDRFAMWQRLAPPMPAGHGSYAFSPHNLVDSIVFQENDTWLKRSHGNMVRQSAPAIMARNLPLPEVSATGLHPYVLAGKFENGAVAVATEGRVTPDASWTHPLASVKLSGVAVNRPIGIFGYYETLTLIFSEGLPGNTVVYARDLLSDQPVDITNRVRIENDRVLIDGSLIEEIGTMSGDEGDLSAPGLMLTVGK